MGKRCKILGCALRMLKNVKIVTRALALVPALIPLIPLTSWNTTKIALHQTGRRHCLWGTVWRVIWQILRPYMERLRWKLFPALRKAAEKDQKRQLTSNSSHFVSSAGRRLHIDNS